MWKYDSDRLEWAMELPKGALPYYPHNDSVIYADFSYGSALVKLSNAHDGGITLAVFNDLPTRDVFADLGSNNVVRNRVERAIRDTLNIPAWYMFTMERDYDSDSEENLKARFGAINSEGLITGFVPALQLTPELQLRFGTRCITNQTKPPKHFTYTEILKMFLYKNGVPVKSQIPRATGCTFMEHSLNFLIHSISELNITSMPSMLKCIVANIEVLKQTFITEYTLNYEC